MDSIGKHFRHLTKAVTSVYPGITISNLVHKIKDLNLKNYKAALLLVGTNDLTPKATWQWYKEKQRHGELGLYDFHFILQPPAQLYRTNIER